MSATKSETLYVNRTHWSKKGSKMITSSPSSMKAMKALSIPVSSRQKELLNRMVELQLTFVGTRRDGYLCLRVQLPPPER